MATTTENMTYERMLAIGKIAQQDMRIARREGELSICDTKVGVIELSYCKATRIYQMVSRWTEERIALRGLKAAGVETRLVGLYKIVVQ
jgi:hypothetical protein